MNISFTQLSTPISMSNTQNAVGVQMLSKSMDLNKELGEGLVNMIDSAAMERSVNPAVGGNFDMSV